MISNPDYLIPVSKAFLPPEDEFNSLIQEIRANGILTNNGLLVRRFEKSLKEYTGVKHAFFVTSGTMALQIALRALVPRGKKIITSAYSAVPTLSSILWEGYEPCFADIDSETLNVSVSDVAKKMSDDIGGVLVPHIYGNSCDISTLEKITSSYQVPLIFDGAHAFGTLYKGQSIMSFGTVSTVSFHAYKILSCAEGGAIFTQDDDIAEKIFRMRYFGYDKEMDVKDTGINGKSSELHAAMGICSLNHIEEIKTSRKIQSEYYDYLLQESLTPVKKPVITEGSQFNYAYYAVILSDEEALQKVGLAFSEDKIQFKRYFYPSLNKLEILENYQPMNVSEDIAARIICLPLFYALTRGEQDLVINALRRALTT
jgi:dTDP-4-amino-4,6-dideoxygalactose transaminase